MKNSKHDMWFVRWLPADELISRALTKKCELETIRYLNSLNQNNLTDTEANRIRFAYRPENYTVDNISEDRLNRLVVCYCRHELSNYHRLIKWSMQYPNQDDLYRFIKITILCRIARVYPAFAAEARRQAQDCALD